jgi:hypothetical protein
MPAWFLLRAEANKPEGSVTYPSPLARGWPYCSGWHSILSMGKGFLTSASALQFLMTSGVLLLRTSRSEPGSGEVEVCPRSWPNCWRSGLLRGSRGAGSRDRTRARQSLSRGSSSCFGRDRVCSRGLTCILVLYLPSRVSRRRAAWTVVACVIIVGESMTGPRSCCSYTPAGLHGLGTHIECGCPSADFGWVLPWVCLPCPRRARTRRRPPFWGEGTSVVTRILLRTHPVRGQARARQSLWRPLRGTSGEAWLLILRSRGTHLDCIFRV